MKIVQFDASRLKNDSVFVQKGLQRLLRKYCISVLKEYRMNRHYEMKHGTQLNGTEGRLSATKQLSFKQSCSAARSIQNYSLRARQRVIVALFPNS